MPDTNDFNILLLATEEFAYGFCLNLNGAGRCLLDEDITIFAVFESEENEIDSFFKTHDKAGHLRFGEGNRVAVADLVNPERDNGTTRTHDITVTGTADLGVTRVARFSYCYLLFNSLGNTHRIDRICSLISRETDDGFHSCFDSCGKDVISTDDVGLDGLHWEELARRYLLEGGSMKDVVNPRHGVLTTLEIANITNKKLDFISVFRIFYLIFMTHIILFFLVTREDTNLCNISTEETVENCVTK